MILSFCFWLIVFQLILLDILKCCFSPLLVYIFISIYVDNVSFSGILFLTCACLDEDRHEGHTYGHNMTCNDDCFNQLFETLSSDKLSSQQRKNHCDSLHSIAGALMYSTLCRNILSDLPEHRAVADKGGPSYRELLCTSDHMKITYSCTEKNI